MTHRVSWVQIPPAPPLYELEGARLQENLVLAFIQNCAASSGNLRCGAMPLLFLSALAMTRKGSTVVFASAFAFSSIRRNDVLMRVGIQFQCCKAGKAATFTKRYSGNLGIQSTECIRTGHIASRSLLIIAKNGSGYQYGESM